MTTSTESSLRRLPKVVIRFAGDSGDGMQLTGDRFTADTATLGNDLATLPNYPAEIRAPAGTLPGVSSFQLQFADHAVATPGDAPDVLVAMNPAALKANVGDLPRGSTVIVDKDQFTKRNLAKVGYAQDPLGDDSLGHLQVHALGLTSMTVAALSDIEGITRKDAERAKNMFALGLLTWLYHRPTEPTKRFLERKFAGKPAVLAANAKAFEAGWSYGETTESFANQYVIEPAKADPGTYRNVTGNYATALGLVSAAHRAGIPLVLGSYPITPASDILHALSGMKRFGVTTMQLEDEIAAVCAAIGASYGGALGVTTTSGPGLCLKSEAIGLAVSLELPLVVVDVQRGGPSTGMPTKTEQGDLLQAMFGRNGEAPLPVVAACTPAGCFNAAIEASRIAVEYRTPVLLLTDGYLANGSEPWKLPRIDELPKIATDFATGGNHKDDKGNEVFQPYRRNTHTLARPWAPPGLAGLEHRIGGIEKADLTGDISYDPDNHQRMTDLRQAKVNGVKVPDLPLDDPDEARLLILGWGSSFGPIKAAVTQARQQGINVAQAHMRHINPFPANTGEVLRRFDRVVVPEMNSGQLRMLLRAEYLVNVVGYNRVRGLPFTSAELADLIVTQSNQLKQGGAR